MHILVTGSSGTIGTGLCEALVGQHQVTPVDRRPNEWNERLSAETLMVDLTRQERLEMLPTDVDIVIHLAANARVYDLVLNPTLAYENIQTTYHVLEYMRHNKIPRIIFASSREVYGSIPEVSAVSEDMVDIKRCESPYTASKMSGEALIYSYSRVYGIEHVVTRFSNVYGKYDNSNRVVPVWISRALKGDPLVIFGPEKELDFTYIDDAIDGVLRMIERFDSARGNPINLSSGSRVGLMSVAEMVREFTASSSELQISTTRPGELWTYRADLSRAKRLLDYSPKVDIQSGLQLAVDWYKNNLSSGVDENPIHSRRPV